MNALVSRCPSWRLLPVSLFQLAMHPPKKKASSEEKKKDQNKGKPVKTFSADDRVETLASDLITGMADDVWVPCKVLSFNGDGTYDVEYTNEWAWVGTTKGVAASQIREPQADVEGKNVRGTLYVGQRACPGSMCGREDPVPGVLMVGSLDRGRCGCSTGCPTPKTMPGARTRTKRRKKKRKRKRRSV